MSLSIAYDTRLHRQDRNKEEVLKNLRIELEEGKINSGQFREKLEEEYYKIFKEGRTEREVKSIARSFAGFDYKFK